MKKSFFIKISIIIILILAFAVIHDVILGIKIERRDNNQETDIVEKEEEVSNNVEVDSIENLQVKETSSWIKCQEKLTCYLDEGEYSIGDVIYSTPTVKTPDNIPFPYPTEEEVDNVNSFIKNQDLRVEVTNDDRFIIKGTNYEEELTLIYDSLENDSIMSVTSELLNYSEQRYFSTFDLEGDLFFSSQAKDTGLGYYTIDVIEMKGELYIAIYIGSAGYFHTLDKI